MKKNIFVFLSICVIAIVVLIVYYCVDDEKRRKNIGIDANIEITSDDTNVDVISVRCVEDDSGNTYTHKEVINGNNVHLERKCGESETCVYTFVVEMKGEIVEFTVHFHRTNTEEVMVWEQNMKIKILNGENIGFELENDNCEFVKALIEEGKNVIDVVERFGSLR